jgi:hypothetical protein
MGNEPNTQKIVVAALIKKDNKFLIAKRKDDTALATDNVLKQAELFADDWSKKDYIKPEV